MMIPRTDPFLGKEPSGIARIGERLTYAYDAAGNLSLKKNNANANYWTSYSVNSLNEITNSMLGTWSVFSGWTASIPINGSTTSPATNVTVNGLSAMLNGDNSFGIVKGVNASSNGFTAIAYDVYGRKSTNISSVTVVPTNNAYAKRGQLMILSYSILRERCHSVSLLCRRRKGVRDDY